MGIRVFLAGTEGSGKTSCIAALLPGLAADHVVLTTDPEAPELWSDGRPRQLLGPRWTRTHRAVRAAFRRVGLHTLFLVPNFGLRLALARALEAAHQPDVSLYDADLLIHPVAYARYHFAPARWLPARHWLRAAGWLAGDRRRTLIFFLARPPSEAAARIAGRDDPRDASLDRDLGRLERELDEVVEAARGCGYEIVRLDAAGRAPAEIARSIDAVVRRHLGATQVPGGRRE
ncbi:MAG: hypothetical protein O7G30_08180 [Proteobacteria bacterium]|nr:hypothetical protein [Pseudomonadota bacterium]